MIRNIQFTSRQTDIKVLIVSLCLGFAAIAGCPLSMPFENFSGQLIGPALSIALAIFAWSVFHLIAPGRYSRKWAMAEHVVVPVVWFLLMLAVGVWCHQLEPAPLERQFLIQA